ncbi:MAG: hypothetical protein F6K65_20195 [Moorea sp. SIO3C2]|nr:hypothetical protein [Moorena sp. SIO3C2]
MAKRHAFGMIAQRAHFVVWLKPGLCDRVISEQRKLLRKNQDQKKTLVTISCHRRP